MSSTFNGFPPGKLDLILPAGFFSEVLTQIDDLAELKLTLFCFWALQQREGEYRFLRYADFRENDDLMTGLCITDPEADPDDLLDETLTRSIERGVLLAVDIELEEGPEALYFVNTARGRNAVEQIKAGNWIAPQANSSLQILPERVNIYALYERNIGALTPHIADELKDAEQEYAAEWIEDAIKLAIERNKRSWAYIRKILENWKQEGRPQHETVQQTGLGDGKEYIGGKYADFFES